MKQKQIRLFNTEGTSDKVYNIKIEPAGKNFVVNFEYGRRGSNLKSDTKTPKPVSEKKAIEIYNSLIAEKQKKGYQIDNESIEKSTPENMYLFQTLVSDKSFSELDFHLQDEFGFENDDNYSADFVVKKKGAADTCEAHPISIDIMIETLQTMKKKGATHIEIEHHVDHIGYDLSAWKIRKATAQEIDEIENKEKKKSVRSEKINKLEKEINTLRKEELEEMED